MAASTGADTAHPFLRVTDGCLTCSSTWPLGITPRIVICTQPTRPSHPSVCRLHPRTPFGHSSQTELRTLQTNPSNHFRKGRKSEGHRREVHMAEASAR
eukprot:640591-Prorocentrum_minimum.AAC.1